MCGDLYPRVSIDRTKGYAMHLAQVNAAQSGSAGLAEGQPPTLLGCVVLKVVLSRHPLERFRVGKLRVGR